MDGVGRGEAAGLEVGAPPAIVADPERAVARASSQVASASPTPAARNAAGARTMSCESTSTRSGLRGKTRYSSNAPSSVAITASADVGASVDATVTQRMPARCPAAFTASTVEPPPTATITSAPASRATPTSRSTSVADGMPPKPSRRMCTPAAANDASTSCCVKPHTTSSATTSGVDPMSATHAPSLAIAPGPCT